MGVEYGAAADPAGPDDGLSARPGEVDVVDDLALPPFGAAPEQHVDVDADRVLPSWSDPVVRSASGLVGGPWGRHGVVGRARFLTPLRVLLAFAVLTLLLAWVKERPCAYDPWTGRLQYTHMCYSDAIPLYGIEGIEQGVLPYYGIDPGVPVGSPTYSWGRVEYPVLIAGFWVVADGFGRVLTDVSESVFSGDSVLSGYEGYFVATCLMLALCYLITVWATSRTAGRRVWDASIVALSPLVVLHAFTNWDLLAVAMMAVAMLLWARRRPVWAGLLIGLGGAAKLYPLLFVGALLVLTVRSGRFRAFGLATGAAVVAWLAVNVPVALSANEGWRIFFDNSRTRPFDIDTLWQLGERTLSALPQFQFVSAISQSTSNALVFGALAVACLGILVLGLVAPERPRVAQLTFLVVAAFLLTGKVWSPQFSLWLLPLIALARPRWRLVLAWQLAEIFLWLTRMQWFIKRDVTVENTTRAAEGKTLALVTGLDYSWFATAIVVRDLLVIALCVLVIREVLDPSLDVVRRSGLDDPAGGAFDGAPDRLRIVSGRLRRLPPPPTVHDPVTTADGRRDRPPEHPSAAAAGGDLRP